MSYHYVTIKMEVPVKKWDSIGSHVHCMMTFDVPDNVDEDEAEFKRKLAAAKELFEGMAGWCTVDEGREWFKGW